ncbi:K(+)-transporting ATPase subunit F [Alkalihalobacterium bogoriense]
MMLLLIGVTLFVGIYLCYVLLHPEKF